MILIIGQTLKGVGKRDVGTGRRVYMDETPVMFENNQIGCQCAYLLDFVGKSSPELKIFHIVRPQKRQNHNGEAVFTWRRGCTGAFNVPL